MIYFIDNTIDTIKSELYKRSDFETFLVWLEDKKELGLDTETEGLFDHENKIIMLQVSDGKDAFVIDTRGNDYLQRLKGRLEDKLIIGQNLKFDYKFLKAAGIILRNIYDTFLVECILTNGLTDRQLGLGAIALKYTGKKLDKTVRNQFTALNGLPFNHKQIVYGAEDVEGLFEIREAQMKEVAKYSLEKVVELENRACLAIADIEFNGLKLDVYKWLELAANVESKIPDYERELDAMVIAEPKLDKFNTRSCQLGLFGEVGRQVNIKWSSPTQISRMLKALGIEVESSSEKEISKYQGEFPIIKKFIDYKKDTKLVTTYGKNFVNFVNNTTGRVHGDFWQILKC